MEIKTIDINEPCIQDIVIRKTETDLCFTTVDGQDESKLFLGDEDDVHFVVNFGDVSNIGFGGTDNWGKDRLPLYIDYKKGSLNYDGVFVDTIKIQEYAGDDDWCKCDLINEGKSVKYTVVKENPYNANRVAYFYHSTDDETIKRGYNEGRKAKKIWCVTVIQSPNPDGKPIGATCTGETVGNGIAVSSKVTGNKIEIGRWSKNAECTESWQVDESKPVPGESFIDFSTVEFRSDNKIYGVVNKDNQTSEKIAFRIPTRLGDFKDYFTVSQEAGSQDLGKYEYSVGLLPDTHMCKANNNESNNWWDEDDFKRSMQFMVDDPNVKFLSSCGDIAESQTNDYVKHPDCTCEADYKELKDMYDVPYWQVAGLRLFSPLGNHDFYGLFESRYGDVITGKKNSECISGYNDSVIHRIADSWPTGQQINGIVPGRGRIVFDLENGKSSPVGQADMRFFSYNDYVDLYARKGGYTGSSIWDPSKGGISDEAIKCAKQYVNSNWSSVKDTLVMWNDGGGHGRNGYSKLNYWLKKDENIYIYLSVDYGNDVWGVVSGWHDRMIHARTIINLNEDDPYIKRMKEFVSDTGYCKDDEAYNYQYYSPNTLIWLKELLENNTGKKIFIFTHHFMPNRVGNGAGIPKNGNWFYSVINPDGVKDERESGKYNKGSNALTGVEFWFINKLMNLYKNVVWFSGHSHISFTSNVNFDNKEYPIVSPAERNEYVYTKSSETPLRESAWCVALPSVSKPRGIVNGQSVRHYEDAEMGIMEVYEKGIKIKGYKIKENNKDVKKLLVEKTIKLL